MSESYERGLELEKLVARLFRSKGYDVKHNVKLAGKSGVEHQIDVYAEFRAPLHTSKVVVECKSYDKPVDKDIVMKLVHEVQDLGVDRGILVTTSYFTTDAVSTAKGYNVDLWDGTKLRELLKEIRAEEISVPINVFYVKPTISAEKAIEIVNNSLKGLFGKRGRIERTSMLFYPFYELNIDAKVHKVRGRLKKKIEERWVSATVLIESVRGTLCKYDSKIGVVRVLSLPTLTDEERRAFRILLTHGSATVPALASLMSCSTAKARKTLQGLVVKGAAIMVKHRRQMSYQLRIKAPDPSSLTPISFNLRIEEGEPKEGTKAKPLLSMEKVEELVDLLWSGRVKDYKIVYYPYYACKVVEKEKRYITAIDMQNGKVDERLSQILTSSYLTTF